MAAGKEDILQMQVARFLKIAAPDLLWFHAANGGYRNPREARKLKDMGVRAGIPDLCFTLPDNQSAYIELKAGKGRLTPAQAEFADLCDRKGIRHAVCRSLEAVEATLRSWGVTLKARAS